MDAWTVLATTVEAIVGLSMIGIVLVAVVATSRWLRRWREK